MSDSEVLVLNSTAVSFEARTVVVTWDATLVPAGFSVEMQLLDDQGAPLQPPPASVPGPHRVVFSGEAITPGAVISVALRLVSPPAKAATVALITLEAPSNITVGWVPGAICVQWNAVPGATSYSLVVSDQAGQPVLPQPPLRAIPENTAGLVIDTTELADKTSYQFVVRAVANRLLGPLSATTEFTVDRSRPNSLVLQDVLSRLTRAQTSVLLSPDTLQASDITDLFQLLLRCPQQNLAVTDGVVSYTPDSVSVAGRARLFDRDGALHATFTDDKNFLRLRLSFELGTMGVNELKAFGLSPRDLFGNEWVAELSGFSSLELTLDSSTRRVRVSGPPAQEPWPVFGIPGVSIAPVTPDFSVQAYRLIDLPTYSSRVKTILTLGSLPLPVYLQLPSGVQPWEAGIEAGSGIALANLTDITTLFGGSPATLPDGLTSIGQLTLHTLVITSPPQRERRWDGILAFSFGNAGDDDSAPTWKVIPDVLELSGLSVALRVRVVSDKAGTLQPSAFGEVVGRFVLGSIPMSLRIPVPGDGDYWVLRGRSQHTGQALRLSDMSCLMQGRAEALESAIAPLGKVEGFTLQHLLLQFRPLPPSPTIKTLELAVDVGSWTIAPLSAWFNVDHLAMTLKVENPLDSQAVRVDGTLSGQLTLGKGPGVSIGFVTRFESQTKRWSLSMGAWPARLPTVHTLSDLLSKDDFENNFPAEMPLKGAVDLNAFGFVYDGEKHYFPSVHVTLRNSLNWRVLNVLTLEKIDVSLDAIRASESAPRSVTGHLKAVLRLVGAELELTASTPAEHAPWQFQGRLLSGYRVDFQAILRKLIAPDITLPSGNGFPTALALQTAEASLEPTTKTFDLVGFAYTDWSLSFADTTFAITGLGGRLHRAGTRPNDVSHGEVIGTFTWDSLSAKASLATGGPGVDTVVQVDVSNVPLDAQSAANKLVGNKGTPWANLSLPAGLPSLNFANVGILVNLSQHLVLLHGASRRFGQMGLLVQKAQDTDQWDYVAAAALAEDFRFASIHTALSPVDRVIRVREAGFGISSLPVESLQALCEKTPQLSRLLKLASGPHATVQLGKGANLWGTLELQANRTPLLTNVQGVLTGVECGPAISAYARIAEKPGDSLFRAQMGEFDLFTAIHFQNIALEYRPGDAAASEQVEDRLSLEGQMCVTVGESTLAFQGALAITEREGHFSLATTQPLDWPLGMPLKLEQMKFALSYYFATQKPTLIELSGRAAFGTRAPDGKYPVNLIALLLFSGGKPEVVSIALTEPLEVVALLTTVLPDKLWPTGWLKITFETGRLWYAPAEKTLDAITYKEGLNLATSIDIYGFKFIVEVSVVSSGEKRGLVATGRSAAAIPLFIARLTSEDYSPEAPETPGGPGVMITTVGQNTRLGLGFGLVLFKRYMGKAQLSYSVTHSEFEGDVFAPFMNTTASMKFAWSKAKGFQIRDWPLNFVSDAYAYAEKLGDLSATFSSGGCAPFTKLLFDKVVSTHYSVSIKPDYVPPSPPPAGSYLLPLSIICTAKVVDHDLLHASIDIPLVLEAAEQMSYEAFCQALLHTIVNSAKAIVEELLTHPEKLAKFISVAGLQKLAGGTLASLLCRGVKSELIEAQSAAEATASTEAAGTAAEAAEAGAVLAEGAADAALAASAAEGSIVAAGSIVGIIGVLIGIVAGLKALFGVDKTPQQRQAEAAKERAEQAQARAIKAVEARLAVGTVAMEYLGESQLHVVWPATLGADGYEITLFKGTQPLYSDKVAGPLTITHAELVPGAEYKVQLRAFLVSKTRRFEGAWQHVALTVHEIAPPALPELRQEENQLLLIYGRPLAEGVSRETRVLDASGQPLQPQPTITVNGLQSVIEGAALPHKNTQYIIEIRAVQGHVKSTWVRTPQLYFSALAAPTNLAVIFEYVPLQPQLRASWAGSAEATGYQVCVVSADGHALSPQPTMVQQNREITIALAALAADQNYSLQVAALDAHACVWGPLLGFHTPAATAESLAKILAAQGKRLDETAQLIRRAYPTISISELARILHNSFQPSASAMLIALRTVDASLAESAQVLHRIYPTLSATEAATALMAVYDPEPADARQLAAYLRNRGKPAIEAAVAIMHRFTATTSTELSQLLFDAYQPITAAQLAGVLQHSDMALDVTTRELKRLYPTVSALQLSAALLAAYQGDPTDIYQAAALCRAKDMRPADTAQAIKLSFPAATDLLLAQALLAAYTPPDLSAQELAVALKAGGLPIDRSAALLRQTFPCLTATNLAGILVATYNHS